MVKSLPFIVSALFLSAGAAPSLGQPQEEADAERLRLEEHLLLYGLLPFSSRLRDELGITSLADLDLLTVTSLLAVGVKREHADLVISVAKRMKLTPRTNDASAVHVSRTTTTSVCRVNTFSW